MVFVVPPKMLLHLDRFLHKEKVSGPEGTTLFYDLAERALDAQVSERVKDYISQVMRKEHASSLCMLILSRFD